MYCTKCGAEIAEGSNFCVKCGAKVENAPTENSDKKYWIGVLGITLLISGILTLANIDYDFTSIGHAVGLAVGTLLKVAFPIGGVAFVIWLIKRKKK